MTDQELIEAQAEWLCRFERFHRWDDLRASEQMDYREEALDNFAMLSGMGVVVKGDDQTWPPQYSGKTVARDAGFVRVRPLPTEVSK